MPGVPGQPFPTTIRPPKVNGRYVTTKKWNQMKGLNRSGSKKKHTEELKEVHEPQDHPISMRRVVNISHLAKALYCSRCNSHLFLEDISEEKQRGLVSKLTICCRNCRFPQELYTEEKIQHHKYIYPVNLKLALGMIDSGVGATHINAILSCINVPTVSPPLLKRHENVVGPAIHSVAIESCIQAAKQERELTLAQLEFDGGITFRPDAPQLFTTAAWENFSAIIPVTVSADMGWQRRGNGYKYDSQTGTSSLIGHNTGKILAYQLMSVTCKQCEIRKQPCLLPTCRRNHEGSSKSMEAAAAVLMCKSDTLKEASICVGTLIGDEDSCTAKRIRDEFGNSIERASDVMHSQKSLGRALYKLKLHHKELTTKCIDHFKAMAGTAIKKNKGDVDAVRNNLLAIPEHAFGNHEHCGSWCNYSADPTNYKSKYFHCLGKRDSTLYFEVKKVFERLAQFSAQLAPGGSTQNNESFNMIVTSKAPKARHYGSSASLSYRLDAAASQKNLGVEYVQQVNEKLLISPGECGNQYRKRLHAQRKKFAEAQRKPEEKLKRIRRNIIRNRRNQATERVEGPTYRSGLGFEPETSQEVSSGIRNRKKTIWRPTPIASLSKCQCQNFVKVFFDLETTGLSPKSEIILQISATTMQYNFNTFIIPAQRIPNRSTAVHGIRMNCGKMYQNSVEVIPVDEETALASFIAFLQKFKKVVLVAHNAQFDSKFLCTALLKYPSLLHKARNIIEGFTCTLKVFRRKFNKKECNIANHKLATLTKYVIGEQYTFVEHNSEFDVKALQDLCAAADITEEELSKCSFKFSAMLRWLDTNRVGEQLSILHEIGLTLKEIRILVKKKHTLETIQELSTQGFDNFKNVLSSILTTSPEVVTQKMFCYFIGKTGEMDGVFYLPTEEKSSPARKSADQCSNSDVTAATAATNTHEAPIAEEQQLEIEGITTSPTEMEPSCQCESAAPSSSLVHEKPSVRPEEFQVPQGRLANGLNGVTNNVHNRQQRKRKAPCHLAEFRL